MKSCGCENQLSHFFPTSSGRKLSRCFPLVRAKAGRGPTTGASWKAFCGFSRPERVGATCPRSIPAPALAGAGFVFGRKMKPGSKCGGSSSANWTKRASWTGVSRFWMAVLLQPKRGRLRWKNQAGQGHEVDGGGRRPRCSSGKPTGLGQSGGSDPGREHAPENLRSPGSWGPAQNSSAARRRRQSVRQRQTPMEPAQARHRPDQPASAGPQKTFAQRWPGTSPLPKQVEDRTHFRLAGKLPSIARPLRPRHQNV